MSSGLDRGAPQNSSWRPIWPNLRSGAGADAASPLEDQLEDTLSLDKTQVDTMKLMWV